MKVKTKFYSNCSSYDWDLAVIPNINLSYRNNKWTDKVNDRWFFIYIDFLFWEYEININW